MAGGSSAKDGWLRVDKKLLIALLRSTRASEPLVAAWLIDNMDVRTNEVFAPGRIVRNEGDWFARRERKLPSRAIWLDCLRKLKSCEGELEAPFIAKVRTSVFMINPTYLYMGSTSKGKELTSRFSELTGAQPPSDDDEQGKGKKKKRQDWIKCNWESMVDLLASLAGREGCVVASMLEWMDRDNRVVATQDMLSHWGSRDSEKVSKTTVTRALRMLKGKGACGLAAPFCVQLCNGCHLVNPTYAFSGSEDARDRLSRDFERQLREREREQRLREQLKKEELEAKRLAEKESERKSMAERRARVARLRARRLKRLMRTSKDTRKTETRNGRTAERRARIARLRDRRQRRLVRTSKDGRKTKTRNGRRGGTKAQSHRKESD